MGGIVTDAVLDGNDGDDVGAICVAVGVKHGPVQAPLWHDPHALLATQAPPLVSVSLPQRRGNAASDDGSQTPAATHELLGVPRHGPANALGTASHTPLLHVKL